MTPLEVADRLFAALSAGDADAVADVYADDAVVWHNFDQVEQSGTDNLRVLRWLTRNVRDLRYDDVRRVEIEDGFVQQHVLRGTTASGKTLEVPACMVVRVRDGKVTRIDEYLDSAHTEALRE